MLNKKPLKNSQSGLTFIELIVVMGIFTAISATVLFNYRNFSNNISLQNLSQEVALLVKRAQTVSTQGIRPSLSQAQINNNLFTEDWVSSYGVAFNRAHSDKSFVYYFNSPSFYSSDFTEDEVDFNILNSSRNLFFRDFIEGNFAVAGCGTLDSECLEEIIISDGSFIDLICLEAEPQNDPNCDEGYQAEQLHISFLRPRLEAHILAFDGETPEPQNPEDFAYSPAYAFIRVSSQDGSSKRFVSFWSTGQISVF